MTVPLISVLIPAYNHERYIADCVESVLAQDWTRMELLIVDDGSSDGTWGEVRRLGVKAKASGRFERVEVATQPNAGICMTWNRLAGMARGDVIALIASDDKYLPGAFRIMMDAMTADDGVGVVVGQNGFMDEDGRDCFWDAGQNTVYDRASAIYPTFNDFLFDLGGVDEDSPRFGSYAELLRCNHIANGYLIRRRYLDKVLPFRPEAPLEDLWLHLQLSKHCRYRSVPAMTFRYRWHAANTVKQTQRIDRLRYQVLKWEERHVRGLSDPQWAKAFAVAMNETRIDFELGEWLKLRKEVTLEEKRKVLTLFGHDFVFKRKKRPGVIA